MATLIFKKYILIIWGFGICFLGMIRTAFSQLHPVVKESSIHFNIRNFGFKTGGSLACPEGSILFTPDDLSKSSFHITIKSESINTDNDTRDEHLREEDYFNVKKYPLIRFESSVIQAINKKGDYEAAGTLTIKDKSKDIILPFKAEKSGNGYLFSGSFKMNRRDFNVGGSSTISNDLTVDIKVLAQ
jgi:polyisoprenoid-binding protein YceI